MTPDDPNVQMVEGLIKLLAGITDEFVLIGGCATGLLITELGFTTVRPTKDVDLITSLATRLEYEKLAEKLRENGFFEDASSNVICRWKVGPFLMDVIPTEEEVFGFSNQWFKEAYDTSELVRLPSGASIKLVKSPYFIATKVVAFHDRGQGDFGASHDIEDIVTVLIGRKGVIDEIKDAQPDLQEFLRDEFEGFLNDQSFLDSLAWHLQPDETSQSRLPNLVGKIRAIAQY